MQPHQRYLITIMHHMVPLTTALGSHAYRSNVTKFGDVLLGSVGDGHAHRLKGLDHILQNRTKCMWSRGEVTKIA